MPELPEVDRFNLSNPGDDDASDVQLLGERVIDEWDLEDAVPVRTNVSTAEVAAREDTSRRMSAAVMIRAELSPATSPFGRSTTSAREPERTGDTSWTGPRRRTDLVDIRGLQYVLTERSEIGDADLEPLKLSVSWLVRSPASTTISLEAKRT